MKRQIELWMDEPEAHDYSAAADYLSLLLAPKLAEALAKKLRRAPIVRRKAKDILRASGLAVLPRTNLFVARNLKKVAKGKPLSPVLLVRGDLRRGLPLVVADGYHRVCASWHFDENAEIPCRIVSCP
jgi:hypothetical protein